MILDGDDVRVYPHGSPEQAAIGRVITCSEDQRSIMIGFPDKPPFVTFADSQVLFLGLRYDIGPWIELTREGHYEIETAEIRNDSIHCFRCDMTSHNLNDVAHLWCGKCHRPHERTAVAGIL